MYPQGNILSRSKSNMPSANMPSANMASMSTGSAMAPFLRKHLLWAIILLAAQAAVALQANSSSDVAIRGSATRPQLFFACCYQGLNELGSLFSDPAIIPELKDLGAGIAFAVPDFTAERARVVRQLNDAGIPLIAWLGLSKEDGYYLNAGNAPLAARQFAEFERWTLDYKLRWEGVGLDIEPNFNEFQAMNGHKWRLAWTLLRRSLDGGRVARARKEYSRLIGDIHARGYSVQTYQLPLIVTERKIRTTLSERILGIVDVRGDVEVLMLYTSFTPALDSALIWRVGPGAQGIAVGSTAADPVVAPLNWEQFSRDLIVASHFTHLVGVYNLEGCVHQGFLPRLNALDWNQSVTIPGPTIKNASRVAMVFETALWVASHLVYFAVAILFAIGYLIGRRYRRKGRPGGGE
jgi:hypothetical protein